MYLNTVEVCLTGQNKTETLSQTIYFLYIKWAGTTFLTNFNLVVEKINAVATEINNTFADTSDLKDEATEIRDETVELRDEVVKLKDAVVATMGATYAGEWNSTDDFTDKLVIFNGDSWVGVTPVIGEAPSQGNWVSVGTPPVVRVETNIDYMANMEEIIYVDTSSGVVTVTMPMAVKHGKVRIIDKEWTFDSFPCNVIDDNGILINKIDDGTAYEIDIKGASRTLEVIENKNNILEWRVV